MSIYMSATFSKNKQEKGFTTYMCQYQIIVSTGGVGVESDIYVYSPLEAQCHPRMMLLTWNSNQYHYPPINLQAGNLRWHKGKSRRSMTIQKGYILFQESCCYTSPHPVEVYPHTSTQSIWPGYIVSRKLVLVWLRWGELRNICPDKTLVRYYHYSWWFMLTTKLGRWKQQQDFQW